MDPAFVREVPGSFTAEMGCRGQWAVLSPAAGLSWCRKLGRQTCEEGEPCPSRPPMLPSLHPPLGRGYHPLTPLFTHSYPLVNQPPVSPLSSDCGRYRSR